MAEPTNTGGQQRAVVDRIVDGRHAVLLVGEEEKEQVVELACLPPGIQSLLRPGAWLQVQFDDGKLVAATTTPALQEEQQGSARRIRDKMEQLRQRGRPTGRS